MFMERDVYGYISAPQPFFLLHHLPRPSHTEEPGGVWPMAMAGRTVWWGGEGVSVDVQGAVGRPTVPASSPDGERGPEVGEGLAQGLPVTERAGRE